MPYISSASNVVQLSYGVAKIIIVFLFRKFCGHPAAFMVPVYYHCTITTLRAGMNTTIIGW